MVAMLLLSYLIAALNTKSNMISRVISRDSVVMSELVIVLLPLFIILSICVPSLALLLLQDHVNRACMMHNLSVVGNQWHWSSYSTASCCNTDTFMLSMSSDPKLYISSTFSNYNEVSLWALRHLDVDNRIVIPMETKIRVVLSSTDVLHCYTIPVLLLKLDCIPGVVIVSSIDAYLPGLVYGQCSELCGSNHRYMPIVVECTCYHNFSDWMKQASGDNCPPLVY